MRLDMSAVDGKLFRDWTSCRHLLENALPDTTSRPTVISVVDGFGRPVFRRNIAPSAANFQHMQNTGNNTPVIDPAGTGLVFRQMPLNRSPCLIRKPEKIAHHEHPCIETQNKKESCNKDNCLIRSYPRRWWSATMIAEGLTTARGNHSVMYLKAEKKQPVPGGGTGCIRQLTEGACELEAGYCLAVLIGGDENHGPDIH
ncbi:hypothetical protein SAMN03159406_00771 [Rhizobium sp. NFR03]|nr:hypothetical protein SAMN03159406_00771 [Rhizobium sp. NFR03]